MKTITRGPKHVGILPFGDTDRGAEITASVMGMTSFGEKLEAGVNFPSIGRVSPERAREFARALLAAADAADALLAAAVAKGE